jgi:anti-anti-sigma regulatory factor
MMEYELKMVNAENETQLLIRGDFTMKSSKVIKEDLLLSVSRNRNEALDLSQVSAIDVAGIQFACAWKKALQIKGRKGSVILPEAENLKDLIVKAGITQIL